MGRLGQSEVHSRATRFVPHALFVLMTFGAVVLFGMVSYYISMAIGMPISGQAVETYLIGGFVAVVFARVFSVLNPSQR